MQRSALMRPIAILLMFSRRSGITFSCDIQITSVEDALDAVLYRVRVFEPVCILQRDATEEVQRLHQVSVELREHPFLFLLHPVPGRQVDVFVDKWVFISVRDVQEFPHHRDAAELDAVHNR